MGRKLSLWLAVIGFSLYGCSTPEMMYQGIYKGLQQRESLEDSKNPSVEPVSATQPDYYNYKQEREKILKEAEN